MLKKKQLIKNSEDYHFLSSKFKISSALCKNIKIVKTFAYHPKRIFPIPINYPLILVDQNKDTYPM